MTAQCNSEAQGANVGVYHPNEAFKAQLARLGDRALNVCSSCGRRHDRKPVASVVRPVSHVQADGETREEMLSNLLNSEDGKKLHAEGNLDLVWASSKDLLAPLLQTPAETKPSYERGQWDAFNQVLRWMAEQGDKEITRSDIFQAVMDMQPEKADPGAEVAISEIQIALDLAHAPGAKYYESASEQYRGHARIAYETLQNLSLEPQ